MSAIKRASLKKGIGGNTSRYLILMAVIALLYILFAFISPGFFSVNTILNFFRQSSALATVSFGMTFIILTAGIDLSVGSSVALIGAVAAIVMQSLAPAGLPLEIIAIIGFITTFIVAGAIGAVNGIIIGYFKVSAFIATLAVMSIARGLTLTITDSSRIMIENDLYDYMGQVSLFGVFPVVILLVIAAFFAANFILTKTVFGRKTYAIGDNPVASRASGIDVRKQTFLTYVFASIFVALGTIIIAGRARSAQPLAAVGFEFEVITAVVLGGTSLLGGQGTLKGTILGVLILSIINTGLGMLDISPFVSFIVKGVLILVAVLINMAAFSRVDKVGKTRADAVETKEVNRVLSSIADGTSRVLKLKGISKRFPGVTALQDVDLEIERGTVHALCGENGAGKSTLIKILSGVYTKDDGEILVDGTPISIKSTMDSNKYGISVIYQELSMVPELNITQNMYLGKEEKSKLRLFIDSRKMLQKTRELLKKFNLVIPPNRRIGSLTVGQQQMVEIAKAVGSNAWIVVMDEPTSAITEADKKNLFSIIQDLKKQGIAVVYITHRMQEILDIADVVTVLRDGLHVITAPISEMNENKLIKYMIGRELSDIFTREKLQLGQVVLEVKNLYRKGVFEPVSFTVREGEVLGFSGLMGAGRTEIMRCIFGLDKPDGGEIYIYGKKVDIRSSMDAIEAGIMLISEDRRREGIVPHLTVRENITLPSLKWLNRAGVVSSAKENEIAAHYIESLAIRTPSQEQYIGNLSGGNQQKVCVARWLARSPKLIIMDEPTRGVDVGAKSEIHKIIANLTSQNMAIILISSEMPEIIGASDRIVVLYKGRVMAELCDYEDMTQENIMAAASGLTGGMEKAANNI